MQVYFYSKCGKKIEESSWHPLNRGCQLNASFTIQDSNRTFFISFIVVLESLSQSPSPPAPGASKFCNELDL